MGARPDALSAAIDQAWQVFDLPAPDDLGLCTDCCMAPDDAAKMQRTRARDLTVAQINDWYGAAFAHEPTRAQVAWLLPRVMEILADGGEVAPYGNQVAFKRLALSGFPGRWSKAEVRAVKAYALAAFDAWLADEIPDSDLDVDGWLCMFALCGLPLEPLLQRLDALPDDHLFDLLQRGPFHPAHRATYPGPFWRESPAASTVMGWYTSDAMLDRLTQAMLAGSEAAVALYDRILATRRGTP